jgi:hypothetical protein
VTLSNAVAITSDEGDALVPGTRARAVAEQEANSTGKTVIIRNPVSDELLAIVRPDVCQLPCLKLYAAIPRRATYK